MLSSHLRCLHEFPEVPADPQLVEERQDRMKQNKADNKQNLAHDRPVPYHDQATTELGGDGLLAVWFCDKLCNIQRIKNHVIV